MDSEMPYFLIWSLCMKCLVHHEGHCIAILTYFSCLHKLEPNKILKHSCHS